MGEESGAHSDVRVARPLEPSGLRLRNQLGWFPAFISRKRSPPPAKGHRSDCPLGREQPAD